MVRIINAFREDRPVGQVLANLGQALFGDMATGEVNRQQAYALQRSNAETDNLMNWMRTGQNLDRLSPDAAAMLVGSGYSPTDFGRIGNIFASTNYGARDDRTTNYAAGIGEYGRTAEAFDMDQANQVAMNDADNAAALARQNAMPMAALDANGNPVFTTQGTTAGFQPVLTNAERQGTVASQMPMTPAQQAAYVGAEPQMETVRGPDGVPILVPRADAAGMPAAVGLDVVRGGVAQNALATPGGLAGLDPNTQTFVGADVTATSKNYQTPDGRVGTTQDGGRTDAITGEPLPQGTVTFAGQLNATDAAGLPNSVKAQQFEALYEAEDTLSLGQMLLDAAGAAAPEQFGAAGAVSNFVRGAVNGLANLAGLAGLPLNSETLAAWAQQNSPNLTQPMLRALFAPNANETQSLAALYVYLAAGALTGQRSRDLSDNDIQIIMPAIGDPMAWGTTQATFIEGINRAQVLIQNRMSANRRRLEGGGAAVPTGAAPANPAAPAATNGTLTPNADGTLTWTPTP